MQILKKEVKENIINASKELFQEKGFANTSMHDIAKKAHISTGNIYRYFRTKQQLLDEMLIEVEEQIEQFLKLIPTTRENMNYEKISDLIIENIVKWYERNSSSMKVLLSCKEQIHYVSFKIKMTNMLTQKISNLTPKRKGKGPDSILVGAITNSMFEGLTYIVANSSDDVKRMEKYLKQFMQITINQIDNRILDVCVNG